MSHKNVIRYFFQKECIQELFGTCVVNKKNKVSDAPSSMQDVISLQLANKVPSYFNIQYQ